MGGGRLFWFLGWVLGARGERGDGGRKRGEVWMEVWVEHVEGIHWDFFRKVDGLIVP